MTAEQGDTVLVQNADTISGPDTHEEFSIGRYLPLTGTGHITGAELPAGNKHNTGYITIINREEGQLRPATKINTDFGFVMLAASLLLITLLAVFARKTISSGLGFLSFRRTPLVSSSGTPEVLSWPPAVRNIFTVINISLFAALSLLLADYLSYEKPSGFMKLTGIIAGAFLAAMMLRHLASVIIAATTGWKTLFREYMKVVHNAWFADALIVFLLNALVMFAPVNSPIPFIISGVIVTAIFLIIRILRLLNIFLNRHISILYFILYLCALEILPVLVIMKILGVF